MWNRPIGQSGGCAGVTGAGRGCDLLKFFGLSSLIYSINVTILLIISLSTDYWEYRGFDFVGLYKVISKSNRSKVFIPRDTDTYLQFLYYYPRPYPDTFELSSVPLRNETFYQSPILVRKYYVNYTGLAPPKPEESPIEKGKYGRLGRRKAWRRRKKTTGSATSLSSSSLSVATKGADNAAAVAPIPSGFDPSMLGPHLDICEIIIFLQYGNLFRDCEDLENPVRTRLGIREGSKKRCESFLFQEPENFIAKNTPAVSYLELAAFACSILCLTSMVIGLISGGISECLPSHESFVVAATAPLIAAMMLTSAIGLFHGKCHLLQRQELIPGEAIPFKKLFQESRTYSHGWSFVLAWICVILCLVNSFVWLNKGQNSGYLPYRGGFGYGADKYQYTPPSVPKSVVKRRESLHKFLSGETLASMLQRAKTKEESKKTESTSSIDTSIEDKRFYSEDNYNVSDDRALIEADCSREELSVRSGEL